MSKKPAAGGGAASARGDTFEGLLPDGPETQHKPFPTSLRMMYSDVDIPDTDLSDPINRKLGELSVFAENVGIEKLTKKVVVTITFKSHDDLNKSKQILKILEFPFINNGTIINKKSSKIDVVLLKSKSMPEEVQDSLEEFPMDVFGNHYQAERKPLLQSVNKFLNPSISSKAKEWKLDPSEWRNLCRLNEYIGPFCCGGQSICIPHPNNQIAQKEIVQMQQPSATRSSITTEGENWTFNRVVYVPKHILEIECYWDPQWKFSHPLQPDPAILISPLVSCIVSPYPKFDQSAFVASLGEQVSVVPNSKFCLTEATISALFKRDYLGNITLDLKTRYAQMLPTRAYTQDPRVSALVFGEDRDGKILFEGFTTRVATPTLLVIHPSNVYCPKRYKFVGNVLIPFHFLEMPEVWVNLKRSDIRISGI